MHHHAADVLPWESAPAVRQEASAADVQPIGQRAHDTDRSPWYVGARYIANAANAAREREREQARVNREAERRARLVALGLRRA